MTHYRIDDPANPPPRDGTLIDLWVAGTCIGTFRWSDEHICWQSCVDQNLLAAGDYVTSWSPIVPPSDEPQEPLPPEVEQEYDDFWKGIVEKDGVIDLRQVKRELADYRMVIRCASKVYGHVTGGQVSKPNTDPDVVCTLADDHYQKCHEDDEPQESVIRWHGPEVAATWPEGSVVLAESQDGIYPISRWVASDYIKPMWSHWRYALIKRGGE